MNRMQRTAYSVVSIEEWNREGIIWAAGLFEGEGSVHIKSNAKYKDRMYPVMFLGSTDEDVVTRFYISVGRLGRIRNSPRIRARNKPFYIWEVFGFEATQCLSAMFWPWLGTRRREKIEEVLTKATDMCIQDRQIAAAKKVCTVEGCGAICFEHRTLCIKHRGREWRAKNREWYSERRRLNKYKKKHPEKAEVIDALLNMLSPKNKGYFYKKETE